MGRRWRNVKWKKGYRVSDDGLVKSFINNRHGIGTKSHILKQEENKHGYYTVQLGRGNRKLVHRLVAEAFIPNPKNLPMVRHLDDNPKNNNVSNLAWGTQVDNMQDCVKHGRLVGNIWPAIEANKKKVTATNLETGERLCFSSGSDASRYLNIPTASISKVLLGKMRQSHKWTFEFTKNKEAI